MQSTNLLGAILSVNETQLAEAASKTVTPDYSGVYVLGGFASVCLALAAIGYLWEEWK